MTRNENAINVLTEVLDYAIEHGLGIADRALAAEALNTLHEALKASPGCGWLPIESAPKDGTRIMLWNGGDEPVFAHWDTSLEWGKGSRPVNDWVSDWLTVDGYDAGADRVHSPTHWQPLPSDPGESSSEDVYCPMCLTKAPVMLWRGKTSQYWELLIRSIKQFAT